MKLSKEDRAGWTKQQKRQYKSQGTLPDLGQAETKTDKCTVLCVRFGNIYGRDYVERLRNMVSRNLTIPYKFVCLTDDNHRIDGVENIVQPNSGYKKGWWHKVHMFDPFLPITGRILYFDLDIVIHSNIDKLVSSYGSEFVGIRDFNRKFHSKWQYLNSSVMSWMHGSHPDIWLQFKKDPTAAQKLMGDQDWIWKLHRNNIKFFPDEWIQSYKWEIRSKNDLTQINGRRRFRTENNDHTADPACSVYVFHGEPKPQDVNDRFIVDNWR